jgi:L-asparaginase II
LTGNTVIGACPDRAKTREHFGIHVLRRLDWITAEEQAALLKHFPPEIRNDHQQIVGSVEVEWDA